MGKFSSINSSRRARLGAERVRHVEESRDSARELADKREDENKDKIVRVLKLMVQYGSIDDRPNGARFIDIALNGDKPKFTPVEKGEFNTVTNSLKPLGLKFYITHLKKSGCEIKDFVRLCEQYQIEISNGIREAAESAPPVTSVKTR